MAPTSSLIEKSKASFEELRHHLHLPGLRARGSSTSPLRCLGFLVTGSGGSSSEGRNGSGSPSTSHSFAVLGQSPSARRGALDHGVGAGNTGPQLITTAGIAGHPNPSISSPIEVQQYHSIPEGLSYRLRKRPRETLFLANGNPGREDEYLPLSLPSQESETSHRRAYNEAARERADEDAREARAADAQAGRRRRRRRTSSHEIRRAYATGNDDWGRVIDDAVRARSPLSHVLGMGIPDWEIDVEGKLEGEVQRLVGEREFGLGEWVAGRVALVAAAQEMMPELPVSRPRHSRPRQEPEKQKAHILDPEVDYTVLRPTPTASESEAILPGLSTHDLASRDPPAQLPNVTDADTSYTRTDTARYRSLETQQSQGRRRLRRHLPHLLAPASSVEEAEAIYARIFDAETGREVTYLPSLQLENKDEGYHYQTRANTLSLIVNDSTTNHVSSPGTLSNPRNESASRNPPDVVKVDPILISSNQRAYERNNSSSSLSSSSSLRSRRRRHQHHHQIENRDRLRQQAAKLLHPTAWQELDSPPPPHPQGQTTSRPNSDSVSERSISSGWRSDSSLPSPPATPPSLLSATTSPPLPLPTLPATPTPYARPQATPLSSSPSLVAPRATMVSTTRTGDFSPMLEDPSSLPATPSSSPSSTPPQPSLSLSSPPSSAFLRSPPLSVPSSLPSTLSPPYLTVKCANWQPFTGDWADATRFLFPYRLELDTEGFGEGLLDGWDF